MRKVISSAWMILMLGIIIAIAFGCGSYNEKRGRGDAPVGSRDDKPAEVVNMPDQFHNLATKCNHGNRVYAHTRANSPPVVVPSDPSCPQPAVR